MRRRDKRFEHLPVVVEEYIRHVVGRVANTLRVRSDVVQELVDHFTDALAEVAEPAAREQAARGLIEQFGDPKLLGALIRRAKKRCRPMWKMAIIRGFQAIGVLVGLYVLAAVYSYFGQPSIKVDYVALINERSRPQVSDDQNAWPIYERAMSLYVEPKAFDLTYTVPEAELDVPLTSGYVTVEQAANELTDAQWGRVEAWIRANQPAWGVLETASRKEYCWVVYPAPPGGAVVQMKSPEVNPLRELLSMGQWRGALAVRQGRPASALEDALTMVRTASHLQTQAVLVMQLNGMGASQQAAQLVRSVLWEDNLSADELARFQAQWAQVYPRGYPLVNLEAERLSTRDMVQRFYTDGGPGGGHLIVSRFLEGLKMWTGKYKEVAMWSLASPLMAGKTETLEKLERLEQLQDEIAAQTPYERSLSPLEMREIRMVMSLSRVRDPLLWVFWSGLSRVSELGYRAKAEYEATLAILALRRYRAEHGQYPDDLNALVQAGYLASIPTDPYSAGPLVYRRVGEDFTLYSAGANFRDDGGYRPPVTASGTAWDGGGPYFTLNLRDRSGEPRYDRVFWPPPLNWPTSQPAKE